MKPMSAANAASIAAAAATGFAASHSPGAVVAVRTPEGTWIQAFGLADTATHESMPADAYQRIGSVTKTFTATILMQLAAQGKLSLDDPISKYVPDVPNGSKITLLDLATMRSGLAEYLGDENGLNPAIFGDTSKSFTLDQLLKLALSKPPVAAPDTAFAYTNTNYLLIQKAAEVASGESWDTLLRTGILDPLHLTLTSYPGGSAAFPEPHAQGYNVLTGGGTGASSVSTDWNPSWAAGSGEMISTASDLLTWDRALATGQGILPASAQVERLQSFRIGDPLHPMYGIGITCTGGWVGHNGQVPGYNTAIRYNVADGDSIVVEMNTDALAAVTPHVQLAIDPVVTDIAQALGHPIPEPGD